MTLKALPQAKVLAAAAEPALKAFLSSLPRLVVVTGLPREAMLVRPRTGAINPASLLERLLLEEQALAPQLPPNPPEEAAAADNRVILNLHPLEAAEVETCLLYTSDAADEMD